MADFAEIAAKAKEDGSAAAATAPPSVASTVAVVDPGDEAVAAETGTVAQEEESTAQFEPVVQLDEVEVKTHEEDEDVLWKMRAKLFIFGETLLNKGTGTKEWVERGIGEVKFLQHKESRIVRVLMRQEKTMKVICNHVADPRIVLKPNAGSDRSWVWNAFDFTEGKLEETTFALRLGNSETANEFSKQFAAAQKIVEEVTAGDEAPAAGAEPGPQEEASGAPGAGEADATAASANEAADALQRLSVAAEENAEKGTTDETAPKPDA